MLNNRLIVLNGATGSISNIKGIYSAFISLLIPLKFGLTMIIIMILSYHTVYSIIGPSNLYEAFESCSKLKIKALILILLLLYKTIFMTFDCTCMRVISVIIPRVEGIL